MGMNVEIEEKYLKELAGGSRKAFEVLYMTYAPRVEYFLRGLLKNDLEAEDITQDIFYKIWSNRETIAQIDKGCGNSLALFSCKYKSCRIFSVTHR